MVIRSSMPPAWYALTIHSPSAAIPNSHPARHCWPNNTSPITFKQLANQPILLCLPHGAQEGFTVTTFIVPAHFTIMSSITALCVLFTDRPRLITPRTHIAFAAHVMSLITSLPREIMVLRGLYRILSRSSSRILRVNRPKTSARVRP